MNGSGLRLNRRGVVWAMVASVAGAALDGCKPREGDASKDVGRERIISLAPSMTETVFALGAGDQMVGRTSFCDYPPEATKLPIVGGFLDANLEAILALSPTLVIGERRPGGRDFDQRLRDQGLRTFFPEMYNLKEIEEMIASLGRMLGKVESAESALRKMNDKLDASTARIAGLKPPRTLLLFDFHPLVAAGPDAFPGELLALAGATNVVAGGGEYPKLDPEGVLSLDPDLVIDGSAGTYKESPEELLRAVPGLSALRALKEGRVHRLETNAAMRPGPRVVEGIEEIAALTHPSGAR